MSRSTSACCVFFKAKDAIRYHKVPGVQTCALPTCWAARHSVRWSSRTLHSGWLELALMPSRLPPCERVTKVGALPSRQLSCPSPVLRPPRTPSRHRRSEEHTSELQSPCNLVCRLLLEK